MSKNYKRINAFVDLFWNWTGLVGLLVGIILVLSIYYMDKSISPSIMYDFSAKTLIEDIDNIVESDTVLTDYTSFFNTFIESEKDQLLKVFKISSKDGNEILIVNERDLKPFFECHIILKKNYPESISGEIIIEKNNWSGNYFINIVIGIFGWICTTLLLNIYYVVRKGTNDLTRSDTEIADKVIEKVDSLTDQENYKALSKIDSEIKLSIDDVNDNFTKVIEQFFTGHQIFQLGLYSKYPHHIPIYSKSNNDLKEVREAKHGLYIWKNNVGPTYYAQIANSFLKYTKKSIKSTSYYDNQQFLKLLEDGELDKWLTDVNQKKQDNVSFDIKRVHVFSQTFESKSSENFISELTSNEAGKLKYKELYIADLGDDYRIHIIPVNDTKKDFLGEYIVFDDKVMLRYDKSFCILEVFIGSFIMDEISFPFTRNFDDSGYFNLDIKNKIIDALDA